MADVYLNLDQLAESEKYIDEVEPYMRKNADGVGHLLLSIPSASDWL